jgi:hypothetical protein
MLRKKSASVLKKQSLKERQWVVQAHIKQELQALMPKLNDAKNKEQVLLAQRASSTPLLQSGVDSHGFVASKSKSSGQSSLQNHVRVLHGLLPLTIDRGVSKAEYNKISKTLKPRAFGLKTPLRPFVMSIKELRKLQPGLADQLENRPKVVVPDIHAPLPPDNPCETELGFLS